MSLKRSVLIASAPMLALALATPAFAQGPAEEAIELEPLTVTAPVSPLDRSLHLLRLLVEQSAPCLGCDAAVAARDPARARLLSYLLHSEPPAPAAGELLLFDLKVKDSPELEFLRP